MQSDQSVLIVEDDPAVVDLLRFALGQAGFRPVAVGSAEAALAHMARALPCAALIDHVLPRMTGLALLKQLRRDRRTAGMAMIMVTAMNDEQNRIDGLEAGADDYIVKPFSPRELVARVRALLRRRAPERTEMALAFGDLLLDPLARQVTARGVVLPVREVEYALLRTFLARPERVFSRDELLDRVWGESSFVEERTVDVHIRRLRLALGSHYATMVETVRGRGYILTLRNAGSQSLAAN